MATGITLVAGGWAAGKVARACGSAEPSAIVIDEVAEWLTLLPAPIEPLVYVLAFLLFRAFDIWKPWPVRWADRHLSGGFGIMLDDLLAAVYAAFALLVLMTIGGAFGVR